MREIIPGLLYEMNGEEKSRYLNVSIVDSEVFESNKSYFLKLARTNTTMCIFVLGNLARDRSDGIFYYGFHPNTIFDIPATTTFRIMLKRHNFEAMGNLPCLVFYGDSFKFLAFAHNCSLVTKLPVKYFDTTDATMKLPRIIGQNIPIQYKRELTYAIRQNQIYEEKMNQQSPFAEFKWPEGKNLIINFIAPPGYDVVTPAMAFPKWFNKTVSKDRQMEFVDRKKFKGQAKKLLEQDTSVVSFNVSSVKLNFENVHVVYVFMDIPFVTLQYYLLNFADITADGRWSGPTVKKITSWYNTILDKPHPRNNSSIIYYYPKNALPDRHNKIWPDFEMISKYKPFGYQFFKTE